MELNDAIKYCKHDYQVYPDIFTTNSGLDVIEPVNKLHAVKTWGDKRKVTLDITSWIGISMEAIHYYGKLVIQGVNMVYDDKPDTCTIIDEKKYPLGSYKYHLKIHRPLTKKELDEQSDRWVGYEVSDLTNCFERIQDLIEYAKEIIKLRFVGEWEFEIIYPNGKNLKLEIQ